MHLTATAITVASAVVMNAVVASPISQNGPISADPSPTSLNMPTATSTTTDNDGNDSLFPAFNASNYPHHNFTEHHHHHNCSHNSTEPNLEYHHRHHQNCSCSHDLPVSYKSGNETHNVTVFTSDEKSPCHCEYCHHTQNDTKHDGEDHLAARDFDDGELEKMKASIYEAEKLGGAGHAKRASGEDMGGKAIPKYVEEMKSAAGGKANEGETGAD
ncbi:hypothetical protein ACLMJK_009242 [Lecanora helva]